MALGEQLGMGRRESQDTRGRLRDDFEAIDYFESNPTTITIGTFNIKINIGSVVGSDLFILGHESFGKLGSSKLGDTDITTNRQYETRIWEEWNEPFTTVGSRDTGSTDVTWDTTGSLDFSTGSQAQSSILSYDLSVATLNKVRITVAGSNIGSLVTSAAVDGGTIFSTVPQNEWFELTTTGSGTVWRLIDTSGNSIVTNLKSEWRSDDL